jgi:hypothetical protein
MLIGIDVAKTELVVANDERGVRTLVERLRRGAPDWCSVH